VNGSGQVLQSGAAGAGNPSAYTSSVQMGETADPWADLESGLMLLVFGRTLETKAAAPGTAPGSKSFAADGKSLLIQPNSGVVGVGADPGIQKQVAAYLKDAKQRTQRQVLLEARIVEVTLGNDSQMGVDWNGLLSTNGRPSSASLATGGTLNSNVNPAQGLLKIVAQNRRVQATLTALARDNRLKVLSAPRLATLNNQKAILRVVREEAYSLPSSQITPGTAAGGAVATGSIQPLIVPVGIILDILPQIGDDGVITLAVNPSISEIAEQRSFQLPNPGGVAADQVTATLPVVDRRDLDAVVRIRSGETMVLAGIIRSKETTDNRGVPWVRNIPLLGKLFSKTEKSLSRTELAIFITPTLMEETSQVEGERLGAERRLGTAGADRYPPDPKPEPGQP
jgi:MSHA type pilus biogenesis protein MshL